MEKHLNGAALNDSIQLQRTSEAYFADHTFDPDGMINRLSQFHETAHTSGYSGGRVIGEMAPAIIQMEGANRLLEYEARVNMLLRDKPMVVMCQYNARAFDGATLMDVLKAHALMVVRGTIVHNPYYLPPEELLGA
ncbi:MAG: MEDS domain-containing protein [Alkalispirochaeta sp.]